MSMIVARMEKRKSTNLGGMQKHNQREFENPSNKDIDKTRSHLNYDLVNAANIDYREKIMNNIESQKKGSRAIRKDAVLVNEWLVTSDQDFFKGMVKKEQDEFFKHATAWFQDRYGKQNMVFAQVHLDETTPHMHLGVVPMRDGKLQAKNVFNRQELLDVQEELPKFLKDKGFMIDRGTEGSKTKHLTVSEYKEMVKDIEKIKQEKEQITAETSELVSKVFEKREEVKVLTEEYKAVEGEYERLKSNFKKENKEFEEIKEKINDVKSSEKKIDKVQVVEDTNLFGKPTGKVEIDKKDWTEVKKMASLSETLKKENVALGTENKSLQQRNRVLQNEIKDVYKENHELKRENKKLNKYIERFGQFLKQFKLEEKFNAFVNGLQKMFTRDKGRDQ